MGALTTLTEEPSTEAQQNGRVENSGEDGQEGSSPREGNRFPSPSGSTSSNSPTNENDATTESEHLDIANNKKASEKRMRALMAIMDDLQSPAAHVPDDIFRYRTVPIPSISPDVADSSVDVESRLRLVFLPRF